MSIEPESIREPAQVRVDLVAGIVLIAIAAVFITGAGSGSMDWLFPLALAWLVVIIGAYLIIRGLLGFGETVPVKPPLLRGEGIDVAIFTGMAVVYVVLAEPIGFWLVSVAMLFGGSVYLATEGRDRRTLAYSAVVAVVVCVAAYVLLLHVFYVPLPEARWLPF